MTRRKAISTKTRFEIFKRDSFTCQYCGATPPKVLLEVDHILAVANGGDNDVDNLVTSCEECNRGKGARALSATVPSLNDRALRVAEQELQIEAYAEVMAARRERIDREAWEIVYALYGRDEIGIDWLRSIKMFLGKLPFDEVLDAAERAKLQWRTEAQTFRYFCGVCWKKIKA